MRGQPVAGAAGINQSRCVSTWISDFPTLCVTADATYAMMAG